MGKTNIIMMVLTFVGAISGCQESQKMSNECREAYEANSQMYDYNWRTAS
ncbi:MAG: hypothetical protein J7K65_02690 [Planctomycetes bacterium]|nr:hypothetical protein [Planctomycetota bacterium]